MEKLKQEDVNAIFESLFKDKNLGKHEIIFRIWEDDDCNYYKVDANVVYKHNQDDRFRMPVIIAEKNGKFQDFYYNDSDCCWKPLTEENTSLRDSWIAEEVVWGEKDVIPAKFKYESASGYEEVLDLDNKKPIDIDFEN